MSETPLEALERRRNAEMEGHARRLADLGAKIGAAEPSIEFERGETVGLDGATVTFLASEGRWAWLKYPNGACATSELSDLRKLPPPFAVVLPRGEFFEVHVSVGGWVNSFKIEENANELARRLNAAFAARMAAEKAGAK